MSVTEDATTPSRSNRRKQRTKAALIAAAQGFIAEGRLNVSVLDLTNAADVGNGSFYNHFASKEELFQAASDAALEAHGALMDEYTADLADPAEAFTQSFRLTGRLHRRYPTLSRVILQRGTSVQSIDHGLAPRALRDIRAATEAGRFVIEDLDVALAVVTGAALALGELLHSQPERDDTEATDALTYQVLLALGMPAAQARQLSTKPLDDSRHP